MSTQINLSQIFQIIEERTLRYIEVLKRKIECLGEEYDLARKFGQYYILCPCCGRIDIMNRNTFRRKKKCSICGCNELVKLSKEDYIKIMTERINREIEVVKVFAEFCKLFMKKLVELDFPIFGFEFDVTKMTFDKPSFIALVMDNYRENNRIEINFHYFSKHREMKLLSEVLKIIKENEMFSKVFNEVAIIVDSRPDHCLVESKIMEKLGFTRTLDYMIFIPVNEIEQFYQKLIQYIQ